MRYHISFFLTKNFNFEQKTKTFEKGKGVVKGKCHGNYPFELSKNAK